LEREEKEEDRKIGRRRKEMRREEIRRREEARKIGIGEEKDESIVYNIQYNNSNV